MDTNKNTLCKEERLCSKKAIEQLFSGGAKSLSAFPVRAVFMLTERTEDNAPVSILVSVSKKKFKRAVKRNRIKRLIREAYRKNKHGLIRLMEEKGQRLVIAFIYLDNELHTAENIENKIKDILGRVMDKLE